MFAILLLQRIATKLRFEIHSLISAPTIISSLKLTSRIHQVMSKNRMNYKVRPLPLIVVSQAQPAPSTVVSTPYRATDQSVGTKLPRARGAEIRRAWLVDSPSHAAPLRGRKIRRRRRTTKKGCNSFLSTRMKSEDEDLRCRSTVETEGRSSHNHRALCSIVLLCFSSPARSHPICTSPSTVRLCLLCGLISYLNRQPCFFLKQQPFIPER